MQTALPLACFLSVIRMVGYCRLSVRRDVALVKYMVRVLRGELHHPAVLAALRLRAPNDYLGARRRPAMLEVPSCPPGVQYENSLLQIAPVDKSKCPYVKGGNDVAFQLFTRHNPTVAQELKIGDDERLFASNIDMHDTTVIYFHAWMETIEDGSAVMVRESYMQRGDTNVIMVDARSLQAGPWYFTAAQNTWYIGRFAGQFIDYLVTRGLNLNNTHLVGHSLGAHVAGVAGSGIKSGKVARITGLDAALPLFEHLPLPQRLDPTDAHFVDNIHTDSGIFGYKAPLGHVDFYPNAGISPQPGCELEVVIPKKLLLNKFFCSHWRSYQYYAESVIRPIGFKATECNSWREYKTGACAFGRTIHMGYGADTNTALSAISGDARTQTNGFFTYYLQGKQQSTYKTNSLEYKLEKLFNFIHAVKAKSEKKDSKVTLDRVRDNIDGLYDFKDSLVEFMKDYDNDNEEVIIDDWNSNDDKNKSTDDVNDDREEISSKNDDQPTDTTKDVVIEDDLKNVSQDDQAFKKGKNEEITMRDKGNLKIQISSTTEVEDLIAEETSIDTLIHSDIDKIKSTVETIKKDTFDKSKVRRKRETNLTNLELTVVSGNLTLNKEDKKSEIPTAEATFKTTEKPEVLDTKRPKSDDGATIIDKDDNFEDDGVVEAKEIKKNAPKPMKINLFRRRPLLGIAIRLIPRINKMRKEKSNKNADSKTKAPKFLQLKGKSGFKLRPLKPKILRRSKRFVSLFRRAEEDNNILFKILDFLVKNRKNVLPVFTVAREINTLVKSANGELNHFSKESNNYIGATPPSFTPITYSLELGNENRAMSFVKRLFGIIPKGDRLTINAK